LTNRIIIFRILFGFAIFFWASTTLLAETNRTYHAHLYLQEQEANFFEVEIITPKVGSKKAAYIFRPSTPSGYGEIPIEEYIRNFQAFDKDGKELKVEPEQDDRNNFHPHGLTIRPNEFYMINFQLALGYLNNFIYLPYQIHIHKGEDVEVRDVLNYTQLENETAFLGNVDQFEFDVYEITYFVNYYSEVGDKHLAAIKRELPVLVEEALAFMEAAVSQHITLNILLKEPNDEGVFGGAVHGDAYTFVIRDVNTENLFLKQLSHLVVHELLHTLTPYSVRSHLTDLKHRTQFEYSQHLWLYEGVTEYLALLTLLRTGQFTERDFSRELWRDYKAYEKLPAHSLTEVASNRNKEKYKSLVNSVYHKGTLLAFLLDLEITEKSEGKNSLLKTLLQLKFEYGPDRPIKEEELFDLFSKYSQVNLDSFFEQYVIGMGPLNFEDKLLTLGWQLFKGEKISRHSFGDFRLKADQEARTRIAMKTNSKSC